MNHNSKGDYMNMKLNQVLTGKVSDYTYDGLGVVKVDNFPFFVNDCIVGENITFQITKLKKNLGFGKLVKVVEASLSRMEPICEHYFTCGGCQLMHMKYEEQVSFKKNQFESTFHRIARKPNFAVDEVIKAELIYDYRNKSIQPFGLDSKGNAILGMYSKNTHKINQISHCSVRSNQMNLIFQAIENKVNELNISVYNEKNHSGLLRNVVIKQSFSNNQFMIIYVITKATEPIIQLAHAIDQQFESVISSYININTAKTNVVLSNKFSRIVGEEALTDSLLEHRFLIGPASFYQIHSSQTEALYKKAYEYANLSKNDIVLDAYCGIGSIGIPIAKDVQKVVGIELIDEAIEYAKMNAVINNLSNCEYYSGDAKVVLEKLKENGYKFDVVFVDPPRKGLQKEFIELVQNLNVKRFVYISCNPSTLARDVEIFEENGYKLQKASMVDMFPNTTHIEGVALLTKEG